MQEKIYTHKQNGMLMMILLILLIAASFAALIYGGVNEQFVFVAVGAVTLVLSFILLSGLRILKPQEALVLTLY